MKTFGLRKLALGAAGLAVAGALAFGGAARAQEADATPTPATVYVNGHGAVMVEPDAATVTIGIDVMKPTLAEAQAEATTQMTAVIDAIKAAGVAEEDIQTAYFNVNVLRNYDEQGNLGEVIGFQVTNTVNVVVRDVANLGALLDQVVTAGANNIYGIGFMVTDPTAAASEARKLAFEDARAKAEELAAAAGLTLGRIVSISENYSPTPSARAYDMAESALGGAVPIQTGSTEISVDISVTWELAS